MPGIFGIIDPSTRHSAGGAAELQELAVRMASAMLCDASHSTEVISSMEVGCCVGRVGSMVATAASTRSGFSVLTTTGASELARLTSDNLDGCLADVDGPIAGLVIDSRRMSCCLFNDRYGMERLFVHTDGSRTFFASEAKGILAAAPRTRSLSMKGLAQFIACGGTLGRESLFQGIEVLPAATIVTFSQAGIAGSRTYFDRRTLEQLEPASEREFTDGLGASLHAAVHAATGDGAAGISLTGGLDSRMIMASLDAPAGSVPCYTFGSMYQETYDVIVARQVAELAGQPFHEIRLDTRFLSTIDEHLTTAVRISDGYIGLSGAAELFVNRTARTLAPARVTGNWGGELLRGVRAFKYVEPKGDFLSPDLARELRSSADEFDAASAAHTNALSYTLFQQMPVAGYGRLAVERSQVRMRAPFLANAVIEWLYRAPLSARQSNDASIAAIRRRPALLGVATDMGFLGASAAPVAFARQLHRRLTFKAEYLVSHGAPNWMATLTSLPIGKRVERRFVGRHKFQHFRRWLRSDLAGFARESLLGGAHPLHQWFDMSRVERMIDDHVAGRGNYTDEIDKLLTVTNTSRHLLKPVDALVNPSGASLVVARP